MLAAGNLALGLRDVIAEPSTEGLDTLLEAIEALARSPDIEVQNLVYVQIFDTLDFEDPRTNAAVAGFRPATKSLHEDWRRRIAEYENSVGDGD